MTKEELKNLKQDVDTVEIRMYSPLVIKELLGHIKTQEDDIKDLKDLLLRAQGTI